MCPAPIRDWWTRRRPGSAAVEVDDPGDEPARLARDGPTIVPERTGRITGRSARSISPGRDRGSRERTASGPGDRRGPLPGKTNPMSPGRSGSASTRPADRGKDEPTGRWASTPGPSLADRPVSPGNLDVSSKPEVSITPPGRSFGRTPGKSNPISARRRPRGRTNPGATHRSRSRSGGGTKPDSSPDLTTGKDEPNPGRAATGVGPVRGLPAKRSQSLPATPRAMTPPPVCPDLAPGRAGSSWILSRSGTAMSTLSRPSRRRRPPGLRARGGARLDLPESPGRPLTVA